MEKPKLLQCILVDAIGMVSYLLPGWGESIDIIWAPIAGIIFYIWFRKPLGTFLAIFEELIPFTDLIPIFTIYYFIKQNNIRNEELEEMVRIKKELEEVKKINK